MASYNLTTITDIGSKTYIINPSSDNHVYISHGSAGIGQTEETIANKLLAEGINVTIIDYFTKNNIKKLFWLDTPTCTDRNKVSLQDIIDVDLPYGKNKFHIGFSLGGYVGLANCDKFQKNYCFYPGCLPLPKEMESFDYSNTKIFIGLNDNWCLAGVTNFVSALKHVPTVEYLKDCYHSFMAVDKFLETEVIRFYINEYFVDVDTLSAIQFDTEKLKSIYKWERISVTLKFNRDAYDRCLEQIIQDIKNYRA